jgi:ABC-type dipeptide/oligopeptide/nickel transport system ATPase subunit
VKGLSLRMDQGQHLLIVGNSGAGKSSLLRAIAGYVCIFMCVCVYVCMYVYTRVCVNIYSLLESVGQESRLCLEPLQGMYAFMHACMHVCTRVCV